MSESKEKTSNDCIGKYKNSDTQSENSQDDMVLNSLSSSDITSIDDKALQSVLHFIIEADKIKNIFRRNLIVDGSRRENDAEHSWHIAFMAMLLESWAPKEIHLKRVLKMCLIHDLVEIYAGDTFAYDEEGYKDKLDRETKAADKLFDQLPRDMGMELRTLWEEFDIMETTDSQYAASLDRIQPFVNNLLTNGHTWLSAKITKGQVYERMGIVQTGIPKLWEWVERNIERAMQKGWICQ